ncbi:MAG: HAD hydrolase-like protein [Boseongicola sp. SB0676_bin_33]|nr:HAD hydrolase-like protein [Boseongicola sp. SB0676_bin_33]
MTAIFLDLDGTLVESHPGILESLRHALESTGHHALAETDLAWMIGPPFDESFRKMGLSNPDTVMAAYREHYRQGGMFDARVYDGVLDALGLLRESGARMYLATAKPHVYARQVTRHFGLAEYMQREFGPELDGTRSWKGDLLAHALAETGEDVVKAVMVGDREHDMAAAKEVGMKGIAVSWGYGNEEEWHDADTVIDRPNALKSAIGRLGLQLDAPDPSRFMPARGDVACKA